MPGEACAHTKIELDTRSYRVGLRFVEIGGMMCGVNDMCSFDVGKMCSYCAASATQSLVALCCHRPNLGAYMLTFAVAVGPDIEHVGPASVTLDIFLNRLVVATNENVDASWNKGEL
jgi:hypothetical protein